MSIRLRLTLLYSAILALTLILFSALLYAAQSQYTLNLVKQDLALNARRLLLSLPRLIYESGRTGRPLGFFQPGDPGGLQPLEPRDLRARDMVRLLDGEGTPFDLPLNEDQTALPISEEGMGQLQAGEPWAEVAPGEDGRILIYNQPLQIEGELAGILQLARSLADRDRSLRALGMTLILGSLLTTVLAFGIGWILAGVTLRRIDRITQTALEIGRTRDFSSRVQYQGPKDELGQLATTFNDMLARLQGAYQQVAHALEVQRDFVADVSHELRTPLTTIRGDLALLHRQPPPPKAEQEDILNDLTAESERLIRMVNDLLALARADAGRQLAREPVPLQPLLADVCRQAQVLGPERTIVCDGTDDLIARADPDALKQVLLILLDNAVTHSQGEIQLTSAERDGLVAISVEDSGPGMSLELCERIFDRFYRGDASRSTPGFGLGLSIAKALVEAQEGTIDVESEIGKGSMFTVTLPKAVEP